MNRPLTAASGTNLIQAYFLTKTVIVILFMRVEKRKRALDKEQVHE